MNHETHCLVRALGRPLICSTGDPAEARRIVSENKRLPVIATPAAPVTVPGELERSRPLASGFVAVLTSKKSRMDALKAVADLQQKYAEVLAAKSPEVEEADLDDNGVWYRVVVGPRGSREAATSVCSQLKTAGHAGCWVAAY